MSEVPSPARPDPIARRLAFAAALLFLLGALNGILIAAAKTGALDIDAHSTLAAHMNALLGSFWLLGLAFSMQFSRLGERGRNVLAWMITVPAYANFLVTQLKAVFGVSGLSFTGEAKNDLIAVLLNVFVVIPTLVGAGLWAWGLRPGGGPGTSAAD